MKEKKNDIKKPQTPLNGFDRFTEGDDNMPESAQEYYTRWGFIRDLLFNNIADINNNSLSNSFQKSQECLNSVMVIVIDNYFSLVDSREIDEKRNIRFSTYDCIENGIKHKCNSIPVAIEDNIFAVFFQYQQDDKSQIEYALDLGLYLKDYVNNHNGVSISIGIGRAYRKLEDLVFSYQDALAALDHRFYHGNSQVMHYENIIPYAQDINFLSQELHSQLLTKTLACDLDSANRIIEDIIKETMAKSINPFLVKIRFVDSLIDIINQSNLYGKDDLNSKINKMSGQIFKTDTVYELQDQLEIAMKEFIHVIKSNRKKINRQVFETAIEYIYQNYNKSITLDDVAKHVYISPYYFSHGFKEYIGMSFVEYLKKIRIEEAKKLLLTTDMSISKICCKVGYNDPHYFSRVFKSVMGVSPRVFLCKP